MSTTAYWQPVTPAKPSGSCLSLKSLLFDEGERSIGARIIVRKTDARCIYLYGYRDALPEDRELKGVLSQFIEDLEQHEQLEVWIDE
jgi:hypothetical protein